MSVPPLPPSLLPPRGQSMAVWIRRTFRSRKALSGVTQWFIDWGIPIFLVIGFVWVFGAGRSEKGWSGIYRVFTLIDRPVHVSSWGASILGWLLVPALIGGVAGHVIAARMQRVKEIATNQLFQRRGLKRRLKPPGRITFLESLHLKSAEDQEFLDRYVRRAHRGDWKKAQDHWEVLVRDVLCTVELAELDRNEALESAESVARAVMWVTGYQDKCLVCTARAHQP
ncbi:hypothetical protein GCM10010503_31160 [Streptomyces lucensis JCM 4490]|uniref:Uncharacterized protein n=1 Tax=Streptomyces lucensis JCM 4490 TaxID=1306176 RepID=A0A918J6P1_9ACTN|nr:DUF6313 family protein [Streptomyces lucensis]GGW51978.1 hypothetical protein GCM10010503_31160 [Streptomyces lucensis JCM 4490]